MTTLMRLSSSPQMHSMRLGVKISCENFRSAANKKVNSFGLSELMRQTDSKYNTTTSVDYYLLVYNNVIRNTKKDTYYGN